REVVSGVATAMGGSCEINVMSGEVGLPPCVNDPAMTELVRLAAIAAVGKDEVSDEDVMTTGSDDMAYFLDAVPGCYFIVGAENKEKGAYFPHHHPRFKLDEDGLPIGVEVLTRPA